MAIENLSAERKKLQKDGVLPSWYTTQAWQMFKKSYLVEGEAAVIGRFKTIAKALSRHLGKYSDEYEQKFFDLMWRGILSPASPALANTGTGRGMPVSCSGQVVDDSVYGFYESLKETAVLSKNGFGTSADFSNIRPRGSKYGLNGKANGASDVIDDFFSCAGKISQNGKRRGAFAAYIDIEHDDFYECCDKLLTDSDGRNYGWVVRDSFISKLQSGDKDSLERYHKAVSTKVVTGKGYFFFVDKANRARPEAYVKNGLDIKATNLCTEIMLHSSPEYTYSCILSSLNLVHWDEIKDSDAAFTATVFLDCLCQEFIETATGVKGLERVVEFTKKGRAIGLGVMGFHTYLQSKRIPYASLDAQYLSSEIAEHLQAESLRASKWLAEINGEPEWCKGLGVANTHRTAYAPTKSTAILMGGVSESWSPDPGMVFEAASAAGELSRIPPEFYKLMIEKGQYSKENIDSIIDNLGSVQHFDWLDDDEKRVFLNAFEIDQWSIFNMAEQRQKYTCQGQSLNFFFGDDSEDKIREITRACFLSENILSMYYFYSRSGVVVKDECVACSA